MSGHSKWATIKHKKGAADARRGKVFTKLIKELMVAARMGGGNPEGNPRLRAALLAAKAENMPKDNIDRAIKKGTGELEGVNYEEMMYEGYGPGGVAVLVDIMTDNRNRAAAEIRHIFSRNSGNLGEAGCVAWMFNKKGSIVFDKKAVPEEELIELALEAGAEDVKDQEDQFEVIIAPEDFLNVKAAFDDRELKYELAEITMSPQTTVRIEDPKTAQQLLRLMDALEDSDDVQNVYANFDIPDQIMESLE
ncbi:MAG: YebC/PmpR family DNA-binding transcriptional regulator [Syntrophobacteraceae bacterium]